MSVPKEAMLEVNRRERPHRRAAEQRYELPTSEVEKWWPIIKAANIKPE